MSNLQMKDSNGKIYKGWSIVIGGMFLNVLGYSCIVAAVGLFLTPITEDLGLAIGDFVLWTTIMSVTSMVYLLFSQKIYSEKTTRPLMIISCLFGVAGYAGFATSHSLIQFYVFAICLGICFAGITTTPCSLLITNWFGPKLRGKALGVMFGGTGVLYMFAVPCLNYLIYNLGWRSAYFFLAGAMLVICLPIILFLTTWSPEKAGIKRRGDFEEGETVDNHLEGMSFKDGLKKPSTWLMFLSGTFLVIGSSSILTHTPTLLIMNGISATFAANVMSILSGLCVFTTIFAGAISDRFGIRICALITGIAFASTYAALLGTHSLGIVMVITFMACYAIGIPSVNVVSPSIANYMFGEKEVGAFIGYVNLFISIGGALGSTIVGKLLDATGSYTVPFTVCIILTLIMVLIRLVVTGPKYKFRSDKEV